MQITEHDFLKYDQYFITPDFKSNDSVRDNMVYSLKDKFQNKLSFATHNAEEIKTIKGNISLKNIIYNYSDKNIAAGYVASSSRRIK